MEDLIDIQGIDHISWWPLAWGWWLIIVLLSTICSIALYYWMEKRKYKQSWKYQSYSRLQSLQSQLSQIEPKIALQSLSLELRNIAMLSNKRENCAGLTGQQWLRWLEEQDPNKFAWLEHGASLTAVQYMPDASNINQDQIMQLIKAAKEWVCK